MKRCPNRHITTGANFCTVCGEKLVEINETCAQCGKPIIDPTSSAAIAERKLMIRSSGHHEIGAQRQRQSTL
jgi:predicted amidophosphoribosyltransferase